MSRWMIRQEFGEYLREHSWIWKAPFLATTAMVWAGAIVVSLGLWQGDSGPPSRACTLPPPASVEVEDTAEDRASLRAESPQAV